MREVYPDIFMVTEKLPIGGSTFSVNVYVISGHDGLIFDAGYGARTSVNYLIKRIRRIESLSRSMGKKCHITRVLPSHSHPDHFSGMTPLKKKLGIKTVLTKKMAHTLQSTKHFYNHYLTPDDRNGLQVNFIERIMGSTIVPYLYGMSVVSDPDEIIEENSVLNINDTPWQVLPSPGHSYDHIVLYNPKTGVLFSGDNVFRSVTTWLGPPGSDLKLYSRSLENILSLPKLELILSGHGSPITNPRQRIKELLKHRQERTETICQIIKKSGKRGITVTQISKTLYAARKEILKRYVWGMGYIQLTIHELEKDGRIIGTTVGGEKHFIGA
jgi:glyoxylase-like metal-dependent hydrolase (beta-lactamase superfamily II)